MSKVRGMSIGILALAAIGLIADSAIAKNVSVQEGKKAIANCDGATWSKSSTKNGTYGCINKDGSGVVCGGKEPKPGTKTCDTFREAPRCLPTRGEAAKAEMAGEKTQKH